MNNYAPLFRPSALLSYFVAFIIGSLYAQVFPTLSVFLVERFSARAFDLGVFFVALAASSIVVSQVIGWFSDKGANRLMLIFIGMTAGALACILFSISTSYWMAMAVGVFVFSLSAITLPQIMAHAREYANAELASTQVVLFNSILRASFALSWIAGPPMGFHLQHLLGTEQHYLYLSGFYVLVGAIAWWFLPRLTREARSTQTANFDPIPFNLKLGFVAFALLFGVNHSYMIALPQLLAQHLHIETFYAGCIMGTAAGLEIPIMLLGGWLATRMPLLPLLRIGGLSAVVLYVGVWQSNSLWHLFALQVFNAVFVGTVGGLGMTWFQDQMPKQAGAASSLFGNAINLGNILGSLILGIFAAWLGYQQLYMVNAIAGLIAIALLLLCRQGMPKNAP